MTKRQNSKQYDLEDRTLEFARRVRAFVKRLKRTVANTEDGKQLALTQVLYYFTKMREVAMRVTDTEVKLTLPNQKTSKGRSFTIEGIVDIVRDDNETWMYDIKTHDTDYIESNKELYEKQLNVFNFLIFRIKWNNFTDGNGIDLLW